MTAPAWAEQDYAEFTRWWQAKGYPDGAAVDFSDARDAFGSGMRAARAIAAAPPAVTVEALEAALADREILVTRVHGQPGELVWRAILLRPHALAVQLLSAIDARLTDNQPSQSGDTQ